MASTQRADASYEAKDITVLEGLDAVRKRPAMYIGSTGPRGLHHLVWEVVDNAIDEAMAGYCTRIEVVLLARTAESRSRTTGAASLSTSMPKTKLPAITTVLTTLHAGGKFGDGAYTVSGGLHGVGVSVVNALSDRLEVEVVRDGSLWHQEFKAGVPKGKLAKVKPAKRTGTTVVFWPSADIFQETTEFSYQVVASRLREMAFLNSGLEIRLTDERPEEPLHECIQYKGGLVDYVKHLNGKRDPLHAHILTVSETSDDMEIDLAMQWTSGYTENILSFANNINTHEGGTHEEGFRKALTRAINEFARDRNILKEKDPNLAGEDVREGMTAIVSVKMRNPQFEGQTKTKLGNTEARSFVEVAMNRLLPEWLEQAPRRGTQDRRQVLQCGPGPHRRQGRQGPDQAQEPARVLGPPRQVGRLLVPRSGLVRDLHRRGRLGGRLCQAGPQQPVPGDPPHSGQDHQRREGPPGQGAAEHRDPGADHGDRHRHRRRVRSREGPLPPGRHPDRCRRRRRPHSDTAVDVLLPPHEATHRGGVRLHRPATAVPVEAGQEHPVGLLGRSTRRDAQGPGRQERTASSATRVWER